MLYNPQLKTFLIVAETGSFNKAAEKLYISATAVIKQMNSLEAGLGLALFHRSNHGLTLTEAGNALYGEARRIIRDSERILTKARQAEKEDRAVRIGVSPFNPPSYLEGLLPKLQAACPELLFEIVQFENTLTDVTDILRNLGREADLIFGSCSRDLFGVSGLASRVLFREPMTLAVPVKDPLSQEETIRIEDLYGKQIYILKEGLLENADRVRRFLLDEHPQVRIVDSDFYDFAGFNICVEQDILLLMISNANVHPLMKVCSVDWPFMIEFGAIYAVDHTQKVERVLQELQKMYPESYEIR